MAEAAEVVNEQREVLGVLSFTPECHRFAKIEARRVLDSSHIIVSSGVSQKRQ